MGDSVIGGALKKGLKRPSSAQLGAASKKHTRIARKAGFCPDPRLVVSSKHSYCTVSRTEYSSSDFIWWEM
ncbi:MAG: hypothetical protein EBZ48_15635 [Proteobacteria bacterium]|nr:hypothetical protein [Pseudomonadota bacterium]